MKNKWQAYFFNHRLCLLIFSSFLLSFAANAGGFAAIAYSVRAKKWAEYHGATTRAEAEFAALRSCGRLDCKIVVWVQNGHAVLATNEWNDYGVGYAHSFFAAKMEALHSCPGYCRPTAWTSAFW